MTEFQSLEQYIQQYDIGEWFSSSHPVELALHTFPRGERIYREGEELTHFYFLVEGRIKVYSTHYNGKVTIVEFGMPFDIIGDLEFTKVRSTSLNVAAVSDVACVGFPIRPYQDGLLTDAHFLLNLVQTISRRMMVNTVYFSKNLAYPVDQRLALYIQITRHGNVFSERLTELSDFLGVSYRHVQRVLSSLCKQGILKREGNGYRILNSSYFENAADHM